MGQGFKSPPGLILFTLEQNDKITGSENNRCVLSITLVSSKRMPEFEGQGVTCSIKL